MTDLDARKSLGIFIGFSGLNQNCNLNVECSYRRRKGDLPMARSVNLALGLKLGDS